MLPLKTCQDNIAYHVNLGQEDLTVKSQFSCSYFSFISPQAEGGMRLQGRGEERQTPILPTRQTKAVRLKKRGEGGEEREREGRSAKEG